MLAHLAHMFAYYSADTSVGLFVQIWKCTQDSIFAKAPHSNFFDALLHNKAPDAICRHLLMAATAAAMAALQHLCNISCHKIVVQACANLQDRATAKQTSAEGLHSISLCLGSYSCASTCVLTLRLAKKPSMQCKLH
jgi:hypothetical protein